MPRDTAIRGQVVASAAPTVAKQSDHINASGVAATQQNPSRNATATDLLDHCAGRLSYAHELAEQIRPLLLAIERLAEADHTIAGLASIGSETLDAVVADICGARDELNEQVRLAQRREFCDFVERSAS